MKNIDIDIKSPRFLRWVVAVVVLAVVTPLWLTQTSLPITYASRQQQIAQLEEQHAGLSRDLEKARLLVRNLERVEREYETLHQQWQVASTLLPEANEMPLLLRQVTAAGKQSGVDFKLFRPDPVVAREFYTDNPVAVRIQGGYHQTGVFLSRLANLNRIVNVENLRLKGVAQQKDDENGNDTVETELTLTAYTLTGGGVPDGAAGGARQLASADADSNATASMAQ
ncbi:MAG TPA: type 4a pilus biogenesis protein PilO [Candidatus Krumholzibacteria bacterium]|nr:type 4a pilus biogenesis protein PilO [Candidatus Krumholzibacteria bacterium]HPD71466.1 type 4a pilus biogenesis protein PilO [Candidatus Krumholzibacteria bacterium]HRY41601.1 type 4a pilus biogenesis protein PilO [Candidatus Krumholzibacteria bacterium]